MIHHNSCNRLQKKCFLRQTNMRKQIWKSPRFYKNNTWGFFEKPVSFSKIVISWLLTQMELSHNSGIATLWWNCHSFLPKFDRRNMTMKLSDQLINYARSCYQVLLPGSLWKKEGETLEWSHLKKKKKNVWGNWF